MPDSGFIAQDHLQSEGSQFLKQAISLWLLNFEDPVKLNSDNYQEAGAILDSDHAFPPLNKKTSFRLENSTYQDIHKLVVKWTLDPSE